MKSGSRSRDGPRRDRRDRGGQSRRERPGNEGVSGGSSHSDPNMSRPVVLLKRPDSVHGIGSIASRPPVLLKSSASEKSVETSRKSETTHDPGSGRSSPQVVLASRPSKPCLWTTVHGQPTIHESVQSASSSRGSDVQKIIQPVKVLKTSRNAAPVEVSAVPFINVGKEMIVAQDLEFLSANANSVDYFVISVIGAPKSGKSSLVSYLAGDEAFTDCKYFRSRKYSEQKEGFGYMSKEKLLLIEMPSVFNGSATLDMIAMMGGQENLETATVAWSLKIMNWALSVSHMVIVISDQIVDANMFQLTSTASIINPSEFIFGGNCHSEVVYVCNKAAPSLLEDDNIINAARMIFQSSLGADRKDGDNLLVLPRTSGHGNEKKYSEFKSRIMKAVRYHRAINVVESKGAKRFPRNLPLHEWLQLASKYWLEFGQSSSSGINSYLRLLP